MSNLAETSIPWIGQIPTDWDIKPLFSVATENKTKNKERNENVLSLSYGRIIRRDLSKNFGLLPENFDGYQVVETGYIIIRSTDLQNDKKSLRVGLVKENGVITSAYIGLSPSESIHPEYLFYYLNMCDLKKVFYSLGGGLRQSLRFEEFKRFPVIVPPIQEQKLISRYLDKKTSQIDSLVEKIQKKIELLKEQRTSLINHYVTKGLDPNVEIKDSGVEWIGEIPKHWKMTKLKYLCPNGVQYGLNIDSDSYQENGVRFVRITDITSDGRLKQTDGVYLSQNDVPDEYYVRKNDILFSRSGGTVGKSIRIEDINSDASFAGYLVRFSFEDSDLSKFVKLVTESGFFWKWIDIQIIQSTIQNVNGEKYSNFSFPLPPKDERRSIVHLLQDKLKIIVKNIINNEVKIKLLLEYRQSLISSVVTGNVRVTGDMI